MKGRVSKFFLPIFIGIFILVAGVFLLPGFVPVDAQMTQIDPPNLDNGNGSITVCKVIVDENDNIVDGSAKPGVTFSIPGIIPAQTSGGAPAGQIGNSQSTTPLSFNKNLFGTDDAQCITYSNLALGNYYYGEESINPSSGWASPKYNDQFTVPVTTLADFFGYDGNLFDGNASNDGSRNQNADGHIVLDSQRPDRTLIVLNKITARASSQSTGGPSGGGGVFTCPVVGLPQKVDPVWFSGVSATSVTVHWGNLADANGYHIAYGLQPNNWLWGVKVGNVSQYTLNNLPTSNIWVTVIPLGNDDCPGVQSDATQVGSIQPQVLGATGTASNLALFLAGFGILGMGLWQLQTTLLAKERKNTK